MKHTISNSILHPQSLIGVFLQQHQLKENNKTKIYTHIQTQLNMFKIINVYFHPSTRKPKKKVPFQHSNECKTYCTFIQCKFSEYRNKITWIA